MTKWSVFGMVYYNGQLKEEGNYKDGKEEGLGNRIMKMVN